MFDLPLTEPKVTKYLLAFKMCPNLEKEYYVSVPSAYISSQSTLHMHSQLMCIV
jgi:hypothetical protein